MSSALLPSLFLGKPMPRQMLSALKPCLVCLVPVTRVSFAAMFLSRYICFPIVQFTSPGVLEPDVSTTMPLAGGLSIKPVARELLGLWMWPEVYLAPRSPKRQLYRKGSFSVPWACSPESNLRASHVNFVQPWNSVEESCIVFCRLLHTGSVATASVKLSG